MKRTLSLILAFVFVIGICASSPITLTANAASVDDLTFELNDDGTLLSDSSDTLEKVFMLKQPYDNWHREF